MLVEGLKGAGLRHLLTEMDCQDAIARAVCKSKDAMAICLCDGAGSYDYVREGAERLAQDASAACASALPVLLKMSKDDVIRFFLAVIKKTLAKLHEEFEADCEAFASTLICCGYEVNTGRYIVVHLGDGACIVEGLDGGIVQATNSGSNEARSTYLSTSSCSEILDNMKVAKGVAKSVILTSDGSEGLFYTPGEEKVTVYTRELLQKLHGDRNTFFDEINELVFEKYLPEDDFSLAVLSRESSDPTIPFCGLHRRVAGLRRRTRAFSRYAEARRCGYGQMQAARRANWGRRNRRRKLSQMGTVVHSW